jgi:hypothetical protein
MGFERVQQRHWGTERSWAEGVGTALRDTPVKMYYFHYAEEPATRGGRYDYAGVMWRLIAYSRSSAFVFTFNVSIIRYL